MAFVSAILLILLPSNSDWAHLRDRNYESVFDLRHSSLTYGYSTSQRPAWDVIQSYVIAGVIWTWTSFHFDILSKQGEHVIKNLAAKFAWALLGIFAPEVILYLAIKDMLRLRKLTAAFKTIRAEILPRGVTHYANEWTFAHSLYARKGGFTNFNAGPEGVDHSTPARSRIVTVEELLAATALGQQTPDLSSAAINDHSKSDRFIKILTAIQAAYLLLQIAFRSAVAQESLGLYDHTVALYATYSILLLYLWLDVPRDVVPVNIQTAIERTSNYPDLVDLIPYGRLEWSDRVKARIEQYLRGPVDWWPLQQKRKAIPPGKTRVIWQCTCGEAIKVDLDQKMVPVLAPVVEAEGTIIHLSSIIVLPVSPLLPQHVSVSRNFQADPNTHIGSAAGSQTLGVATAVPPIIPIYAPNRPPTAGESSLQKSCEKLFWCVEKTDTTTEVCRLDLHDVDDLNIAAKLLEYYRHIRGWKWLLSMKHCSGASLVKFRTLATQAEAVKIYQHQIPERSSPQQYRYDYFDPETEFIQFVEAVLTHRLRNPKLCDTPILEMLPKKQQGDLALHVGAEGFGAYSLTTWCFWKLAVLLALAHIPCAIFTWRWLAGHPGDLQNALILELTLFACLNLWGTLQSGIKT